MTNFGGNGEVESSSGARNMVARGDLSAVQDAA